MVLRGMSIGQVTLIQIHTILSVHKAFLRDIHHLAPRIGGEAQSLFVKALIFEQCILQLLC
jgi:hypothetical protein